MINYRLDKNAVDELLRLTEGIYPLTKQIAEQICDGSHPLSPRTQVYGAFDNSNGTKSELVSIMTATYCIYFPHKDGTKAVHISGAYTREDMRGNGYASDLLKAIESDARTYFLADYMCCDSTEDGLYENMGFIKASHSENRLWKPLR